MVSAMLRLKMVGAYEEAEVTAARVAACKMGFFQSETAEEWQGDGKDSDGNIITEAEPGMFENLPTGVTFNQYDPQHPNSNYGAFIKFVLRGAAAGLNVSYNGIASDLESVNYSSLRQGAIEERDSWRCLQTWFIQHFHNPVFERWLDRALLTQEIALPFAKFDKFNAPGWQPRGWAWVDPMKEVKANIESVKAGFTSVSAVIASQGGDIEDVFDQIARDNALAESKGITIDLGSSMGGNEQGQTNGGDEDEEGTKKEDE